MSFIDALQPLYSLCGFAVGMLVGFTGVGGGSLMTPLLILLFGIHPATAVGTDLLYAAATKTAGTAVHGWSGSVVWPVVWWLAVGSVPATVLTLAMLQHFGITGERSSAVISDFLGLALILTAGVLIFRQPLLAWASRRLPERDAAQTRRLTILTGFILGILVAMSSVGAGALGVTALLLLYPKLPTNRIVGSDIAHAVPLTLAAGLCHWMIGSVNLSLLGSLLAGSIPGIIIGSALSGRVPDKALRTVLAGTLVVAGVKLIG